jgi:hypothetical protein
MERIEWPLLYPSLHCTILTEVPEPLLSLELMEEGAERQLLLTRIKKKTTSHVLYATVESIL